MAKVKSRDKKRKVSKKLKTNNPLVKVRADALKALEEQRAPAAKALDAEDNIPRCLVVRRGRLGRFAKELIADLRLVMSPYTPVNLKEKRSNTIRDYVAVRSVLGLSHLMTISQTDNGPNLGLARLPRGPTLSFKIRAFSPCSFLRKTLKRGTGENSKAAFQHQPLVVLNNFEDPENGRHVKVLAKMFQGMFPAINVKTVRLKECRRVLLVNYDRETDTVDMRHYLIKADPQGASRSVRKLLKERLPNLSGKSDMSEIVEPGTRFGDGAETSDSEVEDQNAAVSLPQDFPGKGNQAGKRSVVRLREIGPRIALELVKVQDGVFEGEVQYHKYQSRTSEEVEAQRKAVEEKARLTEERKKQQEENVDRKRKAEEEKQKRKKARLEARKTRMLEKVKTYEGAEALTEASKTEAEASTTTVVADAAVASEPAKKKPRTRKDKSKAVQEDKEGAQDGAE